jgi:hypothetical protein
MSTSLDPKIIRNISEKVYKRFPEVTGVNPTIRKQAVGKTNSESKNEVKVTPSYLLTYRGSVDIGNGKKMERFVRVVVNGSGKILKMTTSR